MLAVGRPVIIVSMLTIPVVLGGALVLMFLKVVPGHVLPVVGYVSMFLTSVKPSVISRGRMVGAVSLILPAAVLVRVVGEVIVGG